ncbi:LPS-assembly protein LptD [Hahella sp. SMD15-11]|uniref:LPS-assembly protein LptD n=1 Tax=Thermohahella caldifontis TaxID=3142973 RepID=A0AB39UUF1_9GAMM
MIGWNKAAGALLGLLCAVAQAEDSPVPDQGAAWLDWQPDQGASLCGGRYVEPAFSPSGLESGAVRVQADKAVGQADLQMQLSGSVQAWQDDWYLTAPLLEYDRTAGQAAAPDGLVARAPGIVVRGEQARYELDTGAMTLTHASWLLHAQHMRGEAGEVESPAPALLRIRDGRLTTCAPPDNDWQLVASEIDLDREQGEGRARHVRLEVRDIPVLYVPWLSFPIDDRRRSGFLYPSFGTSNTGRGMYLAAPYYFNLAPDYDATLYPQYVHGRGLFTELEGRWLGRAASAGTRLGWIAHDSEYARLNPESNARRWGLDVEGRWQWAPEWRSELDLNAVSDDDYLTDLNRNLSIVQSDHLTRRLTTSGNGEDWRLSMELKGFQTVDDSIALSSRPYMTLPRITGSYQIPADERTTFTLAGEYAYFWRDNETLTSTAAINGQRLRWQPQLSRRYASSWGYVEPRVRLDHTDYWLEDAPSGMAAHQGRTVPFAVLDAGIWLDRELDIAGTPYVQSLEPRLFYVWSPAREQSDLPDFDTSVSSFSYSQLFQEDRFSGGDRVGDNNRLTLGVTTRFTRTDTGAEVLRGSLGQILYFEDQTVDLSGSGTTTLGSSSWAGELVWTPNERTDMKVEGQWDPRDSRTEKGATTFSWHDPDYARILNLSHRYLQDDLEQTDVSFVHPVARDVSLLGRWLFELTNHRTIGTLAGMEYTDCCWRVQLVYQRYLKDSSDTSASELDSAVLIRFELRGLGGLGDRFSEALDSQIRHFAARQQTRQTKW